MRGEYFRVAAGFRSQRKALLDAIRDAYASDPELPAVDPGFYERLDALYRHVQHSEFESIQAESDDLAALGRRKDVWHITFAPRHDVALDDFVLAVQKFARSKVIDKCVYSFEQKGTDDATLGHHPHCHMVMSANRTRAHVMQAHSKLSSMCNIRYVPAHRPAELVSNYLVNYVSNDGHKELTKVWDAKWREVHGLCAIYGDPSDFSTTPYQVEGVVVSFE